jgi:hypothetical protein
LKRDGVVAILKIGLSWHTTESSFPYIYRNIDPTVSEDFRRMVFFLSREPLDQRLESSFARIGESDLRPLDVFSAYQALTGQGASSRLLYTDHRIYGLTWKSVSAQIRQYFRKLWKRITEGPAHQWPRASEVMEG